MAKMFRFSEEVTNRSQKGHDTRMSSSNLANTAKWLIKFIKSQQLCLVMQGVRVRVEEQSLVNSLFLLKVQFLEQSLIRALVYVYALRATSPITGVY